MNFNILYDYSDRWYRFVNKSVFYDLLFDISHYCCLNYTVKKSINLLRIFLESGISRALYVKATETIHVKDAHLHCKSKDL